MFRLTLCKMEKALHSNRILLSFTSFIHVNLMFWVYKTKKIKKTNIAVENIEELTANTITSQQKFFKPFRNVFYNKNMMDNNSTDNCISIHYTSWIK